MNPKWVSVVCGVLLLLGIPTGWPYDYYILLRWIISGSSIYLAYGFHKSSLKSWVWFLGAIALLFNPIIPFYLSKSSWVLVDLVSAILFFVIAYSVKNNNI